MTLFLSHRGESDDAPENTLEAFQLAMERDTDGLELDIRLTKDKYVVVVHDADLKRVADSDLVISESTLAELQSVHAVPLFKDVLAILQKGKHCQIELKGTDLGIIGGLKDILDTWNGDRKQLAISSFEEETIKLAADSFPDLPRVLLVDLTEKFGKFPTAAETAGYMRSLNCTGVSFKADPAADKKFVDEMHSLGMRVVCWGVFTDELGFAMANIGVDAMTNNHAVRLRSDFRKKS